MSANPPNSQRAKILNNLQRQLLTITQANGYSRNIYDATMFVKTWAQVAEAETPVIYIVDEDTAYKYGEGRFITVTWNIALYIVMKGATTLDLEEFISDVDTCLVANAPLGFSDTGPVISYIRIKNIITDNQLFAEIEQSQLAKITVALTYTKCYGNR